MPRKNKLHINEDRGPPLDSITKAERSRRTQALLIATTTSCIARYGYAATSLNLIAKEAGVSRGPLHYHYKDRNELMGAVAEALPQTISDKSLKRLLEAEGIEARIAALVDLGLEQHLGDHHIVACELLIATRQDEALADAVLPHLSAGEHAIDIWWSRYARDLGWPQDRLVAFRRLFVAALRGLAIDHIEFGSVGHEAAAALLKDMILNFTSGAGSETDKQARSKGTHR
ncbi:MAG: TetR/AcrR family transcriptional regulator [Parerythrobacter sp.]